MIRRWTRAVVLTGGLLGAAGCSALLDWNDFSGGLGDGGATDGGRADGSVEGGSGEAGGGDASADVTPTPCGTGMQCAPSAPAGWTGPVELYVAPVAQGAAPPCGAGFDATPAFDGNAMLTAPSATCTACSCGAVTGESCDGPVMTFYFDSSCMNAAGTQTVTSSCQPTTIAQSVTVAAPLAAGGSCGADGGVAATTPPVWGQMARACSPTSTTPGSCAGGQVCAAAPASPFSTSVCVMQSGIATACPNAYPTGPQVFYAGIDDMRTCSPCPVRRAHRRPMHHRLPRSDQLRRRFAQRAQRVRGLHEPVARHAGRHTDAREPRKLRRDRRRRCLDGGREREHPLFLLLLSLRRGPAPHAAQVVHVAYNLSPGRTVRTWGHGAQPRDSAGKAAARAVL